MGFGALPTVLFKVIVVQLVTKSRGQFIPGTRNYMVIITKLS